MNGVLLGCSSAVGAAYAHCSEADGGDRGAVKAEGAGGEGHGWWWGDWGRGRLGIGMGFLVRFGDKGKRMET